jgi:hypothetical protein
MKTAADELRRPDGEVIMVVEIFACDASVCADIESAVDDALRELGLGNEATVRRISDPASLVGRGVWRAPGLAVDGRVVSRGKPLSAERVAELLRAAAG